MGDPENWFCCTKLTSEGLISKLSSSTVGTAGAKFTWTNKRDGGAFIAQRLDRAICNDSWLDHWNIVNCNTLLKCHSNHIIPRFKFFNSWTDIDGCEALISAHWNIQC